MPIGRFRLAVLCLGAAAPVAAQVTPPVGAPPAAAPATAPQAGAGDVVVNGTTDARSAWRRAESDHVVVTSRGGEAELRRVSANLEQLYRLLARVYGRTNQPDDTVKLQVVLVDSAASLRTMDLRNLRSQEGPYPASFAGERYYDPREDGALIAVARTDQVVDLNTTDQADRDMDDAVQNGDEDTGSTATRSITHPPIARPWQAVLYSAFAQHYVATYLPAAYPRWYMDGIGALFSTFAVRGDGKVEYANAPEYYRLVFRAYGDLNPGAILTGQYLDAAGSRRGAAWTPYHAWLLAHFFLYGALKPERQAQFRQYMTAVHQGRSLSDAARVFGDLKRLQWEVNGHLERPMSFARTEQAPAAIGEPLVTTLSRGNAALIDARVELASRLAGTPADAAATRARNQWLDEVRRTAGGLPDTADALLVAAEAECRSGHDAECLADAGRVLAGSPDNVAALAWTGIALTHRAVTGPAADRPAALAAARAPIERAIRIDGDAPLPLVAAFRSFTDAGERAPEAAIRGMARVVHRVPDAPGPRLYLAEELMRQGQAELAKRVVYPVLYGAYDSPEKTAAAALFAPAAAAAAASGGPAATGAALVSH